MKIRVMTGGRDIDIPVNEDTTITIVGQDGEDLLGIDFSSYDPDDGNVPEIVVGHWPDGEQWVRLAEIPLNPRS